MANSDWMHASKVDELKPQAQEFWDFFTKFEGVSHWYDDGFLVCQVCWDNSTNDVYARVALNVPGKCKAMDQPLYVTVYSIEEFNKLLSRYGIVGQSGGVK